MLNEFFPWVDWEFFNSTFFTAIAGSLAGAWGGARAAQVIANRAKERDDLRKEIGVMNAATVMASSLCDDLSGLMRQHIKPMKDAFDADLAIVHARLGTPPDQRGAPPVVRGDFRRLRGPSLSLDPLQRIVFEHPGSPRSLKLFLALNEAAAGIRDLNEKRNALVEELKGYRDQEGMLIHRYFGIADVAGRHDEEYKTALEGMHALTMDGIFFSMSLAKVLSRHSIEMSKRYRWKFGRGGPKGIEIDFARLAERGVMPDPANYEDWKPLTTYPLSRQERATAWIKGLFRGLRAKTADAFKPLTKTGA